MTGEWREVTIGELAPFAYGKGLPEGRRKVDGSVPVYGSNGTVGVHDTPLTDGPTVIIGRKGTVGAVHYSAVPCWPIDTTFYLTHSDPLLVRYRYYVLKSLGLDHMNADSAVPGLNRDAAHARRVRVPAEQTEQRAIAHILGTLDDKIELNRRMNETLEAMARALFKSWFVDFEPVRAKAEDRVPVGMDAETAALFPDSFEETELGIVPKGWRVELIGDVLELAYGKALKEENRIPGDIPVFGSNGQVGWHNEKLVDGPGIIVGRKGNPGIVTWSQNDFYAIDTTFYVVLKNQCKSMHYVFHSLRLQDLVSLGADSAVPGLNRNSVYMNQIVVPSSKILEIFDKNVEVLNAMIHANKEQSRTLSTIRDTLLPKLLSGELSVKEGCAI